MIELAAGAYAAQVNRHGGGLAALSHDGTDLVTPQAGESGPPQFRGAVLAPWSNRVADGRYSFDGNEHVLPVTEPERRNALHGLVLDRDWECSERADDAVTLRLELAQPAGYPFELALTLTYALTDSGLTVRLDANNTGATRAPFGCGFHPYIRPGVTPIDAAPLRLEATERLLTDDVRLLPIGQESAVDTPYDFTSAHPIGPLHLDDAFSGIAASDDGRHRLRIGGVEVWWSPAMPWVQLFTPPDRDAIAVEPCTSPPDAFRSGNDLVVIAPDETYRVEWGVRAVA